MLYFSFDLIQNLLNDQYYIIYNKYYEIWIIVYK